MTHKLLPKTPFAKLCFSIAALEPFQPDILGRYRDGYTAAKNAALTLVEDSALVSLLNAAPPDPRKDLAALEEAIERLPWWSLVTADEAVRHTVGFMGDGTYIRREKVLELIAQASRGTDLAAPVPVIVGKMRDFANECLRRYQLNPSYCAEIMHTEDAYRDILKLCELAEMRGAKR